MRKFCEDEEYDYWKFCKLAREVQDEMSTKSGTGNKKPGFMEINPERTQSTPMTKEPMKVCENPNPVQQRACCTELQGRRRGGGDKHNPKDPELGIVSITSEYRLYMYAGSVDMRQGIDGLCGIKSEELGLNPRKPQSVYVFSWHNPKVKKVLIMEYNRYLGIAHTQL